MRGGPSVASNMINWNVVIKQIPKSYYDSAQGKTRKKKNIIEGKKGKQQNLRIVSQDKSQSKKICNHFSLRSLNVPVYSSSCFLAENACKTKKKKRWRLWSTIVLSKTDWFSRRFTVNIKEWKVKCLWILNLTTIWRK